MLFSAPISIIISISVSLLVFNPNVFASEPFVPIQDPAVNNVTARVYVSSIDAYCSGVLVGKRLVLTARHCIDAGYIPHILIGKSQDAELIPVTGYAHLELDHFVTNGLPPKLSIMATIDGIIAMRAGGPRTDAIHGQDLLLLRLARDSKFEPVRILAFSNVRLPNLQSQPMFLAGFPAAISLQFEPSPYGLIPAVYSSLGNCFASSSENWSSVSFRTDCISIGGNSGGPLFTRIDGELYLVGIVSSSKYAEGGNTENLLGPNDALTKTANLSHPRNTSWLQRFL